MIAAPEALARLKAGNRRYADGLQQGHRTGPDRRTALVEGQAPFAVILGCSDSRVPAEIVFDQGLGDLFVIRVAGNFVAPSLIGSVEYAAVQLGTRLVVVLGHSGCGAVRATLDELNSPTPDLSPNLDSVIARIRPAVEPVWAAAAPGTDPEALMDPAVQANVQASVWQLRAGSPLLQTLMQNEGLQIVGAEYTLETGVVDFLSA